jgi:hypothetical protein
VAGASATESAAPSTARGGGHLAPGGAGGLSLSAPSAPPVGVDSIADPNTMDDDEALQAALALSMAMSAPAVPGISSPATPFPATPVPALHARRASLSSWWKRVHAQVVTPPPPHPAPCRHCPRDCMCVHTYSLPDASAGAGVGAMGEEDGEDSGSLLDLDDVSTCHTLRVAPWVRRVLADNEAYVSQLQGRTSSHLRACLTFAHALGAAEGAQGSGGDSVRPEPTPVGPNSGVAGPTLGPSPPACAEESTGSAPGGSDLPHALVASAQAILQDLGVSSTVSRPYLTLRQGRVVPNRDGSRQGRGTCSQDPYRLPPPPPTHTLFHLRVKGTPYGRP